MAEDEELLELIQLVNPLSNVDHLLDFFRITEDEDPMKFGEDV